MSSNQSPPAWRGFQDLMRHRVQDVLLVSSLYDSFILSEDGELWERFLAESLHLNFRHVPGITRVATGAAALALAREQPRFNLVVSSLHVGDVGPVALARALKDAGSGASVVLLAYDNREVTDFVSQPESAALDGVFLWQGDVRILLAIVKLVEDRWNVPHDTGAGGVQAILLVEDSVRFYSSFLPVIYAELSNHTLHLMPEGVNLTHKLMRRKARPKILLGRTYEEAWELFLSHQGSILGIISDIEFPRGGRLEPRAGLELARKVRARRPDMPIMLQSSRAENESFARGVGASFLLKGSPVLLSELRRFMVENFGFGDFVFRTPDGTEVARASDMKELEDKLRTVPVSSIGYHAERNHFSTWLKARTEFALADILRPRKVADFPTVEDLRLDLIAAIQEYRRQRSQRLVADFDRATFDGSASLSRIGGGSMGGKARGLAFVNLLLDESGTRSRFPGVTVFVPQAVVIGTDAFDRFLDAGGLRDFALATDDDEAVLARFLAADLPDDTVRDLAAFLEVSRAPLAVRSSSLLEDSRYQPFAGVYRTLMLPNDHPSAAVRLERLVTAVKRVYASTFTRHARTYREATPYRLEEEKMAVVLQRVVGSARGRRFYPSFAGVARSHNFYPVAPARAEDGVAAVALGFGASVAHGEPCVRFCPRYPRHTASFRSVEDVERNSQRTFLALEMAGSGVGAASGSGADLERYGLDAAEADGTLAAVGSTYSPENDATYDGIARPGRRVVTFAPVWKHGVFPLADVLSHLLEVSARGTAAPVEIEFAVDLGTAPGAPTEFGFLQLRPLASSHETSDLEISETRPEQLVCASRSVLGHGRIETVRDVLVVDPRRFERSHSRAAASDVARMNAALAAQRRTYVLVGAGRWGSTDPLLGIPVTWDQVSAARVIVEAGFRDLRVTPSQGSHFFQNLSALNVGYFTVNPDDGEGFVAWEWLAAQAALAETDWVRHLRFEAPLLVKMNGQKGLGVILKPAARPDRDGAPSSTPVRAAAA